MAMFFFDLQDCYRLFLVLIFSWCIIRRRRRREADDEEDENPYPGDNFLNDGEKGNDFS